MKHTAKSISVRFLRAFDIVCAEQNETAKSLAPKIGTTAEYISTLRKSEKSYIRQDIIANLCEKYHISAEWLLMGKGDMKSNPTLTKIFDLIKQMQSTQDDIISKLLDGLIEFKPGTSCTITELLTQARGRKN